MGTETVDVSDAEVIQNAKDVKLNNPLMGTETFYNTFFILFNIIESC